MSSTSHVLIELQRVQQQQSSVFWLARYKDPMLIQSWPELALASTAWSWMDVEPPGMLSPIWKKLWDHALSWPIQDDLAYVEQSIVSWSEYPVWNSVRSMKLIQLMEQAQPRDWSALMFPQEFQPQRFAYHLLNAVCLHPDNFEKVDLSLVWKLVVDTASLRPELKEILVVKLLGSTDRAWTNILSTLLDEHSDGTVPTRFLDELKSAIPHRASWLSDFERLQQNLGVTTVNRRVLAEQWHILLNRNLWEAQTKSYAMFDFTDAVPGFV